jgi:hypothetical protein
MYAQITRAISGVGVPAKDIINPVFSRVGIIFDNISAGKLYPDQFYKTYSRVDAEGNNKPPVMCQSTFL